MNKFVLFLCMVCAPPAALASIIVQNEMNFPIYVSFTEARLSSVYEVTTISWTAVSANSSREIVNTGDSETYFARSEDGSWQWGGADRHICVPESIDLKYAGTRARIDGFGDAQDCPEYSVRVNGNIIDRNLVWYINNYEATQIGIGDPTAGGGGGGGLGSSHKDGVKIAEENQDALKKELEEVKEEQRLCSLERLKTIATLDILQIDATELARFKKCSEAISSQSEDLAEMQAALRGMVAETAAALSELYGYVDQTLAHSSLGILSPYEDDYQSSGIFHLWKANAFVPYNHEQSEFYGNVSQEYIEMGSVAFQAKLATGFYLSILGFSDSFVFYSTLFNDETRSDDLLSYLSAVTQFNNEIADNKDASLEDQYGFPLDSPVPEGIKKAVTGEIATNAPVEADALKKALKEWPKAPLNEAQNRVGEGLLVLQEAFRVFATEYRGQLETLDKLKSATNGFTELVKTAPIGEIACRGIGITPMGDAIDMFEVSTGQDYCTRETLGTTERLVTAAGFVVGSGAFWRSIAASGSPLIKVGRDGLEKVAGYFSSIAEKIHASDNSVAQLSVTFAEIICKVSNGVTRGKAFKGCDFGKLGEETGEIFDSAKTFTDRLTPGKIRDYLSKVDNIPRENLIGDMESIGLTLKGSDRSRPFLEFVDQHGRTRAKIHPADKATQYHHLHIYDKDGTPMTSALEVIAGKKGYKSPDAHIEIMEP